LLTSNGASTYLEGNASTSAVTLYHASNSPRLATTSTGIDVTGLVTLGTSAGQSIIGDYGTIDTYFINNNSGTLRFHVGGGTTSDEKMRIESSGNVLVGKTSSSATTQGIEARADGRLWVSTSSDDSIFNRAGTDGGILSFRKDGSEVGSIASRGGAVTTLILDPRTNGGGLTGTGNAIIPTSNTGVIGDSNTSLSFGAAGYRFNNLYLSGGVYLGGTGSANKLDDYEEGTFTLTWSGTGGTANSTNVMSYVKVGSRVTINGNTSSAVPNATGTLELTGLPFAANDDAVGAMLYRHMSPPSGAHNLVVYIGSGQTKLQPYWASGSAYSRLTSSQFAVSANNDIYFSITYQTNS
jgi:hypothetical protein